MVILTPSHCYHNALRLSLTYYEAINVAECNCNAGNYFIGTPIDLCYRRGIPSNEHIELSLSSPEVKTMSGSSRGTEGRHN